MGAILPPLPPRPGDSGHWFVRFHRNLSSTMQDHGLFVNRKSTEHRRIVEIRTGACIVCLLGLGRWKPGRGSRRRVRPRHLTIAARTRRPSAVIRIMRLADLDLLCVGKARHYPAVRSRTVTRKFSPAGRLYERAAYHWRHRMSPPRDDGSPLSPWRRLDKASHQESVR